MGLRGPGAGRLKAAAAALPARPRKFPWEKPGLTRAQRVIAFLEALPVSKGVKAGKKMRLLPGQRRFVEALYAVDGKGRRKTRLAIRSEPRGNGKTGLVAGLCLAHLLGPESEGRGEIFSAAIDRQQAGLLFAEMEATILRVPSFAARANIVRFHKRIEVLSGPGQGSIYEALSADARRAHGLSPSLWIFDELAQVQSAELLENLRTAMGKRAESLGIVISTQAPDDDHVLSRMIDDGLSGVDPSILVDLTCVPPEADPFDLPTLLRANPAAGIFLDKRTLADELEQAKRIPAFQSRFRNLRANQRAEADPEARLVTAGVWRMGAGPVDRASLRGCVCYGGLDLSGSRDLTALCLIFPREDGGFDALPQFWTPEGALAARTAAEAERFKEWIAAGHMMAIPGPVIRTDWVAAEVARLAEEFDLRGIAFDRWRIAQFRQDLADTGCTVPLTEWGQGFRDMGPAVEGFAESALTGAIRHGNHPVLTAAVANAITVPDPAGNLKIDKAKGNARGPVRIDGAVALIMALALAKRLESAPRVDVSDLLSNMVWA
ncbi:terminase large subunit [Methylobacterium sp. NEAU 140]|uniref:terminase large subunit n=1 Tax=Methylobacterium sp. NEAU 140 TaxID=3064945 RepID=UPI002733DA58|nr:terminase TerL endonuclease subunit [Methylobacterium sp. NEAU 140]MDP4022336.1 terminase large subunit [Methylobacterium sp. NEAU 140]